MKRCAWLLLLAIGLSGCVPLPVQTNGRVGDVAWSTTALDQATEFNDTERFSFTLGLQEMAGIDLTLTKITWKVWQDGVDLGGEETRTGSWRLPARGTLQQPFVYRLFCPPSTQCPDVGPTSDWDVSFEGNDAQGQSVGFSLKAILPWIPPRAAAGPPAAAQTRAPVVLPPIHIIARRIYYPIHTQ